MSSLEEKVKTLFNAIKHGDEKHQAWLKNKIADHFGLTDRALTSEEQYVVSVEEYRALILKDGDLDVIEPVLDELDALRELTRQQKAKIDGHEQEIKKAIDYASYGDGGSMRHPLDMD